MTTSINNDQIQSDGPLKLLPDVDRTGDSEIKFLKYVPKSETELGRQPRQDHPEDYKLETSLNIKATNSGGVNISGKVGMGCDPIEKLHVKDGNLRIDGGQIQSWGPLSLLPDVDRTGDAEIKFLKYVPKSEAELGHQPNRNNPEDYTIKTSLKIDTNGNLVLGDVDNQRFIFSPVGNNNQPGEYLHITYDNSEGNWKWKNGITLKRGGNVGIGTNEPKTKLDVKGSLKADEIYLQETKRVAIHYGSQGKFGLATQFAPDDTEGLWLEVGEGNAANSQSAGFFLNGNTASLWSSGEGDIFRIYNTKSLGDTEISPCLTIQSNGGFLMRGKPPLFYRSYQPNASKNYVETEFKSNEWLGIIGGFIIRGKKDIEGIKAAVSHKNNYIRFYWNTLGTTDKYIYIQALFIRRELVYVMSAGERLV